MKVTLLGMTQLADDEYDNCDVEDVLFTATSQCYNNSFSLNDALNTSDTKKHNILKSVLESGHTSVSEHISFTFLIENVSRALTHQLVRHRVGFSYSQRSGRYTGLEDDIEWYVVPPTINTEKRLNIYKDIMEKEKQAYIALCDDGVPKEDARMVLGNRTAYKHCGHSKL